MGKLSRLLGVVGDRRVFLLFVVFGHCQSSILLGLEIAQICADAGATLMTATWVSTGMHGEIQRPAVRDCITQLHVVR